MDRVFVCFVHTDLNASTHSEFLVQRKMGAAVH